MEKMTRRMCSLISKMKKLLSQSTKEKSTKVLFVLKHKQVCFSGGESLITGIAVYPHPSRMVVIRNDNIGFFYYFRSRVKFRNESGYNIC